MAKSKEVLSQKKIDSIEKAAKAKQYTVRTETPDAGMSGLYLVVQTSGAMSWAVRYRHAGKPRKLTIGSYPAFGLAKARKAAGAALRLVSEGRDPGAEKAEKAAATADVSFLVPDILDDFVSRHVTVKNRESYVKETKRIIEAELKPRWKHKHVQAIRKHDIVRLLDEIVDRGAPVMANRVRALLSKFFVWAMERDIVESSPIISTRAPSAEIARDRVLTEEDIRLVWLAADNLGYPFGPMVKLLLLTGQRRSEVAGALWDEMELGGNSQLWGISPDRSKNRREHFVPLASSPLGIINALPRIKSSEGERAKHKYLFTTTGDTAVSGFSKAKTQLDAEMLAIAKKEAQERGEDPEHIAIAPWTFHDLRRTAASGMARLGIAVHIVEAVLNHRSGSIKGVAAVYNRYDYADEKREALTVWAAAVEKMVAG